MSASWTKPYFIPVSVAVCIHSSPCLVYRLRKSIRDLPFFRGLAMVNTSIKRLLNSSLLGSSIHSHPYTDRSNPPHEEGRKATSMHTGSRVLFLQRLQTCLSLIPQQSKAQPTVYLSFGWSHSCWRSQMGTAQVCTTGTKNLYEENNGRSFRWISAWTPCEKHKGNSMRSPLKYQLALFLPFYASL